MSRVPEMNDYLEEWQAAMQGEQISTELPPSLSQYQSILNRYESRSKLIRKYAWAIPDKRALQKIMEFGPLVEIGAGNGYWASLLTEMGADIICYDAAPPINGTKNHQSDGPLYHPVEIGGPEKLKEHPHRTLFLCWPPYAKDMGGECIEAYEGGVILLIGESSTGCTGGENMWALLHEHWDMKDGDWVDIPQWDGIHDYLQIWRRK